jgi:hypothetical protein
MLGFDGHDIVACREPLLCNNHEISNYTRAVSRQWLGKQVPVATDTHATIEVLLETPFYTRSVQMGHKENWKRAAVQRGLEPGSRGISLVRSRYQETANGDCNRLKTLVCV